MSVATTEPRTLSYEIARAAFERLSHTPEDRARQIIGNFEESIQRVADELAPLAVNEAQVAAFGEGMAEYREGYIARYTAYLVALSRTASTFIVGPANFPTSRNQKRSNTADKRAAECDDWVARAKRSLRVRIEGLATVDEQEEREWARLKRQLDDDLNTVHQLDTGTHALPYLNRSAWVTSAQGRIKRAVDNGKVGLAVRALDYIRDRQLDWKKPFFADRNGIWAMVSLAVEQAAAVAVLPDEGVVVEDMAGPREVVLHDGGDIRVVENHDIDRIQITFAMKPSEDLRNAMKSAGWNWSPTNGAWQRKITANSRAAAAGFIRGLTRAG